MISVEEAVQRIVAAFSPAGAETVAIGAAAGRVLAQDAVARMNQPPDPVSSMDGYAVRSADAMAAGVTLRVAGAAPAGHPYGGTLGAGEAVRIFTGGVVPEGADSIVIQEDTNAGDGRVTLNVSAIPMRHIRVAGLDFKRGDAIVKAGRRLTARDVSLIAAGRHRGGPGPPAAAVALAATGDELSLPGSPKKPGSIVASSGYALAALIARWGGETIDLGIVPDKAEAGRGDRRPRGGCRPDRHAGRRLGRRSRPGAEGAGTARLRTRFLEDRDAAGESRWIFGRLGGTPLLGLPGNPVSTLVCAMLFLKPAVAAMLGDAGEAEALTARLSREMKENDGRQDYVRARLETRDGERVVEPFGIQDSSMLSVLARADALIVRPPRAPAARAGDIVPIVMLE